MENIEITVERVIPIWWAWAWRFLILSTIGGFVFGAAGGFIAAITGHPELSSMMGALMGFLISLPVSLWALKSALSQNYRGHCLVLIKQTQG